MKVLLCPFRASDLGDAAADGLHDMFAETYTLATESFERRLATSSRRCFEVASNRAGCAPIAEAVLLFWISQGRGDRIVT